MTNTHEFPGKEDVEIVVGDEKQHDFFPRMKIKRWDNEVNFSVGIISDHKGSDKKITDKVEWDDGHGAKSRFYKKLGDRFEFEIILDEKPALGFVLLSIEHKGLDFFYQPYLTQHEIEIGLECADNVPGSYAIYHKTKSGDFSKRGGKNYRAGKFCHIYRPYVTDANGKREWCDLDITDTLMKITMPDGLVYPVVVDPTFGIDPASPGSLGWRVGPASSNEFIGCWAMMGAEAGTADSISAYFHTFVSDTDFIAKCAIYNYVADDDAGNIVKASNELSSINSTGWKLFVVPDSPNLVASTKYHLVFWGNEDTATGASPEVRVACDAVGDAGFYISRDYTGSFEDPLTGEIGIGYRFSLYCTYTIAGVGVAPTSIFIGPFGGPFGGPIQ